MPVKHFSGLLIVVATTLLLSACGTGTKREDAPDYPIDPEHARELRHGKLTGEGGLKLFGGDDSDANGGGNSPIGVNSFLWRATLDTLTFMPITSADPFGGVILTDWYEDPKAPGERFKITALILDRSLRTDAIKVTVHKQSKGQDNLWHDQPVNEALARKLEDTILTQARELRVKSER
jgi:hypothetical protein